MKNNQAFQVPNGPHYLVARVLGDPLNEISVLVVATDLVDVNRRLTNAGFRPGFSIGARTVRVDDVWENAIEDGRIDMDIPAVYATSSYQPRLIVKMVNATPVVFDTVHDNPSH